MHLPHDKLLSTTQTTKQIQGYPLWIRLQKTSLRKLCCHFLTFMFIYNCKLFFLNLNKPYKYCIQIRILHLTSSLLCYMSFRSSLQSHILRVTLYYTTFRQYYQKTGKTDTKAIFNLFNIFSLVA